MTTAEHLSGLVMTKDLFFLNDFLPCRLGLYNKLTAPLQRGKTSLPYERPGYDTKQSDGELWGMQSTPSLPSLPSPLWPGVVAPDKGPIYGLNRTKPCFLESTVFLHLNCVFMLN